MRALAAIQPAACLRAKGIGFLLLFCLPIITAAQKTYNVWAFGDHAGINFNTSPPTALDSTSIFHRDYGPLTYGASVCDRQGNLAFYTNGYSLWNGRSNGIEKYRGRWPWTFFVMPLFCPYPNNDSLFYLFGNATNGVNAGKLIFLSVNKNGNNGEGEIVYPQPSTETNYFTVLNDSASLFIAGTSHCNGRDFWIINHRVNSLYSYQVSSAGVNPVPVITPIASLVPAADYIDLNIKFSANGEKLLIPLKQYNKVVVYDFNNETGIFSEPVSIVFDEGLALDDAEFSADGGKLYAGVFKTGEEGEQHFIYQYDLKAGNEDQVARSAYLLTNNPDRGNYCSPHFCVFLRRTLQLAPDGRIYISMTERTDREFDTHCSIIEQPNEKGDTCLYRKSSFDLKRLYKYINYNYIRSSSFTPRENGIQFQKKVCISSPVNFSLLSNKIDSVAWDFGDSLSGAGNFSNSKTPSHIYPGSGLYRVTAIMHTKCFTDTAIALVHVNPDPAVHIPAGIQDTMVCIGSTITLDVTTPGATGYEWENGFNRPVQVLDKTGAHSVKVTNECSFDIRSFLVSFEACNCDVFVPNAYTPNGDGLNDVFKPLIKCAGLTDKGYRFTVYNRYGEIVFNSGSIGAGWNGLEKNAVAQAGVYNWVVKYIDPNNKKAVVKSGNVTLVR